MPGGIPFRFSTEFRAGQIIWCDHGDPDIDRTAQSDFHTVQSTGKSRPCLVVHVDYQEGTLSLAPFTTFSHPTHPAWVNVKDDPPITPHGRSKFIWVGKPAKTQMILENPDLMDMPPVNPCSFPPISDTNLQNYREKRNAYINQYGVDDAAIMAMVVQQREQRAQAAGPQSKRGGRGAGFTHARGGAFNQGPTAGPSMIYPGPQIQASYFSQPPALVSQTSNFAAPQYHQSASTMFNANSPSNYNPQAMAFLPPTTGPAFNAPNPGYAPNPFQNVLASPNVLAPQATWTATQTAGALSAPTRGQDGNWYQAFAAANGQQYWRRVG
ncbi:hypothetical protein B0H11DRAFT_2293574 [Mycena galericulata]|nr:hypothetical protein B0H11DRAFT_2293574 [Mycena galericulata]